MLAAINAYWCIWMTKSLQLLCLSWFQHHVIDFLQIKSYITSIVVVFTEMVLVKISSQ